ncbi:MAG: VOC family protein [Bradyrhizobiaceae bacterium]|nr:MAG: VOC family protein [Bradyrhizobiaceae bacterium]
MSERPPVAPYLTVSPAAGAIAFYAAAFDAQQKALMPAIDGMRIAHCELEINGGTVFVSDAFPEFGKTRTPLPGEPVTASVSLEFASAEQVDETFTRATRLGAVGEVVPTHSFWGTRTAIVRDPFGQRWIMNAPLNTKKSENGA